LFTTYLIAGVAGKIRRGDQQDPLPVLLGYRQVRRIYLREGPYLLGEAVPCGENTLFRSQPLSRFVDKRFKQLFDRHNQRGFDRFAQENCQ
jgi:hypothetical protein